MFNVFVLMLYTYYGILCSEWLDDGVTTDNVTTSPDGRSYHVVCTTKHFTSFAVLVDVSDVEVRKSYMKTVEHNYMTACLNLIIIIADGHSTI